MRGAKRRRVNRQPQVDTLVAQQRGQRGDVARVGGEVERRVARSVRAVREGRVHGEQFSYSLIIVQTARRMNVVTGTVLAQQRYDLASAAVIGYAVGVALGERIAVQPALKRPVHGGVAGLDE